MDSITFQRTQDEQGRINGIEIRGMLVLENSEQLKKELLGMVDSISNKVKIAISNAEEMDISCIQLIVAFIKQMNELHVSFQLEWILDEDQKTLLENVGLSNELYINQLYA